MPRARTLALAAALTLAVQALAQPYEITWYTIDGGGGTSSGGAYTLSGTIGQPDAAAPLTGGAFTLAPGYWPGVVLEYCPCDLTTNGVLNFDDIDAFVAAFLGGSLDADLDGNGSLNFDDIDAFVNCFLGGCV